MQLLGTYGGIVESNRDPEKLGRLKVRVPHVYGVLAGGSGSSYIGTNDLPWAMPAGMPAGGSKTSGGFSHIPETGDSVWVRFLDGEPEKPVWEWGMQTTEQRDAFKLHSYSLPTLTQPVGKPDRAVWKKWNNAFEINAGGVIATTSQGYSLILTDATAAGSLDGSVKLSTAAGNFLLFDDLTRSATLLLREDLTFNIGGDWLAYANTVRFDAINDIKFTTFGGITGEAADGIQFNSATTFGVDALTSISIQGATALGLTTPATMTLSFAQLQLGAAATEPFVLGTQLASWVTALLAWLSTHVHTSATPGTPTSPPVFPPTFGPSAAQLLSTTIRGQ